MTLGGPPGGTTSAPTEEEEKESRFAFTRFTWGNNASTKIFGVGSDYIGTEDEQYLMDFGFNVRYAYLQAPRDIAYAQVKFGWQVELTNSDTTLLKREPLFEDLSLSTAYGHVFYESADRETKFRPQVSFGLLLPTSQASRNEGKYLSTSFGAGIVHYQELAGSKATWLPNLLAFATFSWSHLFARSYDPVNADLNRPRQTSTGASFLSDQLSMNSFNQDTFKLNLTYFLGVYKDAVSFVNTWGLAIPVKHQFQGDGCDVVVVNQGCVSAGHIQNPNLIFPVTTFDIGLSYDVPDNLGRFDLGYLNESAQLNASGLRRSMFYSPDAQFYMNFVAYFDGIYDKASKALKKKNASAKNHLAELPRWGGAVIR